MSTFELREYQSECLDAIARALAGRRRGTGVGRITRGAVVLPTGMGKTVIFAELAKRWSTSGRVLILVHRDELAEQAYAKVHTADQSLRVGIVKAERNDVAADVIVGSVQTLRNPRRLAQLRNVALVIVDECHHANAASYVTVMEALGCYGDDVSTATPCIGFTATLVRGDKLKPGDVWQEVVYTKDIVWGIRHGHLVDVRGKRVQVKGLDLSRVKRVGEDLQADQVADELLDADAPEQLAQAYSDHAGDRLGAVFWPNVAAATAGMEAFNAAGIASGLILGTTPKEERELAYKQLAAGDLQTLQNVNVLTEGWDCPPVSCIVPARLTQSAGLYMQMIGRGTRPYRHPIGSPAGDVRYARKRDCLVLDPVGVTGRHKLATLADTSMTLHGVNEDETLLEAAQRAEREEAELLELAEQEELLQRQVLERQQLQAKEVSLFAESASTWLQTSNGTWFVPVQGWLLFLWPEGNGLFTVGSCRLDPRPFQDSTVLASGMLQDGAMAFAQSLAKQHDPKGHAERTAAWRHPRSPSASRVRFARSIGVRVAQTMTDADVADAIYVKLAGQALGG